MDPHSRKPREEGEVFRPLIFGEALFDHFPDGSKVLGGAPFNVAWHLRGFKADPVTVTAVGKDSDGAEILRRMGAWGMDTSGVQVHPSRPTGQVTARMVDGEPRYEIEPGQAYDAIAVEGLPPPPVLSGVRLLYHGSLGVRETTSRRALRFLRETLNVPILMDVNLRDPWWDRDGIFALLEGTDWVKVSREEAGILSNRAVKDDDDLMAAARDLRSRCGIGTLVVTMGSDGAVAFRDGEVHRAEAPPVEDVVDPVGAGDAFSAVLAMGIHGAWPLEDALHRAVAFSAELLRFQGATAESPRLYARHLRRWSDAE